MIASKRAIIGSVLPAIKWAKVAPEGPAEVCSFIFDQRFIWLAVVIPSGMVVCGISDFLGHC